MEFEAAELVSKVIQLLPLALRGTRAHFRLWFHSFDPTVELAPSFIPREEWDFPMTVCFLGLRREYLPLLPQIGRTLGAYIETLLTAASVIAKVAGLPSVRVIIPGLAQLPTHIDLPTLEGGWVS